ncbi:MAG TPA: sensor histidine kinase [Nocardioides sp.]|nr:sensor histidine kinase [Nocardioides sp.]
MSATTLQRVARPVPAGVAMVLLLCACVLGLSATVAVGGTHSPSSLLSTAVSVAPVLAFALTGAVVVAARPTHRIGWLLLGGGAAWAVGNGGIDLASYGLDHPGTVPALSVVILGAAVVRDVGWYAVVLGLPIYFPTGHLAGPRWRWLTRSLVVVVVAAVVDTLAAPDANLRLAGWHNPIALPKSWMALDAVAFLLSLPFAVVVAGGAIAQLRRRWKDGDALERQQLTFLAATAGLPVLAGPLSLIPGAPTWLFGVAVLPLPVAIGYAVLARGLYDLRTAANRGLVWLVLSALVALIYAAVLDAVGGAFDVGTVSWLPAVAVGIVAVSFAPMRDVLQRGVDRVLFGRWQEPYEVLARLGQRLEASAGPERLLQEATDELAALGLRGVRIEDLDGHVLASSGGTAPAEDEVPLLAYGERLGVLRFAPPATPLRPADRRLVEDLGVHLGGVLRDHRLTIDLQRALERAVLAREEERRRLRRDLHDGLGPALAGHLLRLDVIERSVTDNPTAAGLVRSLRAELRATVLDVRRVVEGLRPPALDELGLAAALEQAIHRLTSGAGLQVELAVEPLPPLSAAAEVAAFRIGTEAVTNVVRHAGARHCRVELSCEGDALRLEVADDGIGLPPGATAGNGLHTMRERAEEMRGVLTVVGTPAGTTVLAELPVPAATARAVAS